MVPRTCARDSKGYKFFEKLISAEATENKSLAVCLIENKVARIFSNLSFALCIKLIRSILFQGFFNFHKINIMEISDLYTTFFATPTRIQCPSRPSIYGSRVRIIWSRLGRRDPCCWVLQDPWVQYPTIGLYGPAL